MLCAHSGDHFLLAQGLLYCANFVTDWKTWSNQKLFYCQATFAASYSFQVLCKAKALSIWFLELGFKFTFFIPLSSTNSFEMDLENLFAFVQFEIK